MKLKTLKDLEKAVHTGDVIKFLQEENEVGADWMCSVVLAGDLKQEAIKWVKFDLEVIKNNPLLNIEKKIADRFIRVWMKRLNITEDDLK